jgi:hypothetical protein
LESTGADSAEIAEQRIQIDLAGERPSGLGFSVPTATSLASILILFGTAFLNGRRRRLHAAREGLTTLMRRDWTFAYTRLLIEEFRDFLFQD